MKPMDTAPQANASKAAETPLLTGFRYPSGKLWMSQELLEHQDEIVLSATKGPVLSCPNPSSCLSATGFCTGGGCCIRTPMRVVMGSLASTLPALELPRHQQLSPCVNLTLKENNVFPFTLIHSISCDS